MLSEYWKRFFEETGEMRPPCEGEWFCNYTQGLPVKAEFDFKEASFPIIKQKLIEEAENDTE